MSAGWSSQQVGLKNGKKGQPRERCHHSAWFYFGGRSQHLLCRDPEYLKGWAKPRGSASWGSRLPGGEGQGQRDSSSGSEGKGSVKYFLVVSPSPEQGRGEPGGRGLMVVLLGRWLWGSPPSRGSRR